MASCCVKDCDSKRKNGTEVILFSLPENLSYKWKFVIDRPDWEPKQNSKICSNHSSKSDYSTVAKRLEPGAIPLKNETQVIISSGNYYCKVYFAYLHVIQNYTEYVYGYVYMFSKHICSSK